MALGRREARHQTVAAAKTAGVDPSVYWEFKPGQRVMTTDGFPGKVVAVNDGPFAGNEEYEVTLDNGMGGGQYTATLLRPLTTSEASHEKTAADDYPELADILTERPPLEMSVKASKQAKKARVTTAEDEGLDPSGGKWVAVCDEHNTLVNTRTRKQAESSHTDDFCDECRDSKKTATVEDSADGSYESNDDCPNCGAEDRMLRSVDGTEKCENCGYLKSGATASKRTAAITCPNCNGVDSFTSDGKGGFDMCPTCGGMGEVGAHHEWDSNTPLGMGQMGAEESGYTPKHMASKTANGDMQEARQHMRAADGATCKDCGFANVAARGGDTCPLCDGQMSKHPEKYAALSSLVLAALDPSFRFHVTATFSDVRNKAKRLRSEGGVNIIAVGDNTVTANVKGDHGVYETTLVRSPGKTANIAQWHCGCKWAAYSWGRTGRMKRFEGRVCSHALSLQYEAQARGMFGGKVEPDKTRPDWLRPRTRVVVQFDRDTRKNESRPAEPRQKDLHRTYATVQADEAPVDLMVQAALEDGYTADEISMVLTAAKIARVEVDPEPPKSHHRDRSGDLAPCARGGCGHPEGIHGEEGGDCTSAGCTCTHYQGVGAKEGSSKHHKHHHTDHRSKQHSKTHHVPGPQYGAWWHGIGGYGIGYCGVPGCETHNGYSGDGNLADSGSMGGDGGGSTTASASTTQEGQSNGYWGATRKHDPHANPGSTGFASTGDPSNWKGIGTNSISDRMASLASITDEEWDQAGMQALAWNPLPSIGHGLADAGSAAAGAGKWMYHHPMDTLNAAQVGALAIPGVDVVDAGLIGAERAGMYAIPKVIEGAPKALKAGEEAVAAAPKALKAGEEAAGAAAKGVGKVKNWLGRGLRGAEKGVEKGVQEVEQAGKGVAREAEDVAGKGVSRAEKGFGKAKNFLKRELKNGLPGGLLPKPSTPDYQRQQNAMSSEFGLHRASFMAALAAMEADATLDEQPEAALPTTDGDIDMAHEDLDADAQMPVVAHAMDRYDPDHSHDEMGEHTDPAYDYYPETPHIEEHGPDEMFPHLSKAESVEDIVAAFQATAGQKILEGGAPKGSDENDVAAAAREHLAKMSMKSFSPAEQKEIIGEGEGITASNLDRLKIEGTHYEALEAALASASDDDDLELEFS